MKNFLKWTSINIFSFLLIFALADYIYFQIIFQHYKNECIKNNVTIDHNVKYKTYNIIRPTDNTTTNVYKYFLEYKHYLNPIFAQPSLNCIAGGGEKTTYYSIWRFLHLVI